MSDAQQLHLWKSEEGMSWAQKSGKMAQLDPAEHAGSVNPAMLHSLNDAIAAKHTPKAAMDAIIHFLICAT